MLNRLKGRDPGGFSSRFCSNDALREPPCGWNTSQCQPLPMS